MNTLAVDPGFNLEPETGALNPPIFLTRTYARQTPRAEDPRRARWSRQTSRGLILVIWVLLAYGVSPVRAANACQSNADCPTADFCDRGVGSCAGEGICTSRPEICPQVVDPVCGCNSVTYLNACEAARVGMGIAHLGGCVFENDCPGGMPGNVCAEGEYCYLGAGQCGEQILGTCQGTPEVCTYDWTPVCGCDGTTYGNACHAASAGMNIDYAGVCVAPGGCTVATSATDCGDQEYCQIAVGHCGDPSSGTCVAMPEVCTEQWDPVCGCDGLSYSNACHAASAGINLDSSGECVQAPANVPGLSGWLGWGMLAVTLLGVAWRLSRPRSNTSRPA